MTELYNTISSKMYSNFIKYDKLKELTIECFEDSDSNELNIYVNTNSLITHLYNDGIVDFEFSIVSALVNLCAHIRTYYRTRHAVDTKIFLVYSTMEYSSSKVFVPRYNEYNQRKLRGNIRMCEYVNKNIEILKELCKYIPEVYMVVKTVEPAVVILDLIYKEEANGNTAPNVVYSKDIFDYQILSKHPNTVIFRPKRHKGVDTSYAVTPFNVIKMYARDSKAKFEFDGTELPKEYLSLLISLSNLNCRSVMRQLNLNTAYAVLLLVLKETQLSLINLVDTYNTIVTKQKMNMDVIIFCNRFKAIDLTYQLSIYIESVEAKDDSYYIDLDNAPLIQKISNEMFKNNPLDLQRL